MSTFISKRDGWIVAMLWGGAIIAVVGGVGQLSDATMALWLRALVLVVLFAVAGLMLWMLYSTSYTLDATEILVRCGPFRYRVPLAEIESVSPSRNPLSSPACSLDRLLIVWRSGRRRILISPERKPEFMMELSARCPQLAPAGDRLVRRDT